MVDLGRAVISLGRLVGLLGNDGSVQWGFLVDPLDTTLESAANPDEFANLLSALFEAEVVSYGLKADDLAWIPIETVGGIKAGLVWNTTPGSLLRIGFGTQATFNEHASLAVLARLVRLANKEINVELGDIAFGGSFPSPLTFLTGGSIAGRIPPPGTAGPLALGLTVGAQSGERSLVFPEPELAWDGVRMVVFVLRAWLRQAATAGPADSLLQRVDEHLFAMLGDPQTAIPPVFPLDAMQSPPDVEAWRKAVLTTEGEASGALTFLWHARALLTGNKSSNFLGGSIWFALPGPPSANELPPVAGTPPAGELKDDDGRAFLGIRSQTPTPSGARDLVLLLRPPTGDAIEVTLARNEGGKVTRPPIDNNASAAIAKAVGQLSNSGLAVVSSDQPPVTLSFFEAMLSNSDAPELNGLYSLRLDFTDGKPVWLRLVTPSPTPSLDLLSPAKVDPQKALADIVPWILNTLVPPATSDPAVVKLTNLLAQLLAEHFVGPEPDAVTVLRRLAAVLKPADGKLDIGPLAITLGESTIASEMTLGPFAAGDLQVGGAEAPVHVGKVKLTASGGDTNGFGVALTDLRLGRIGQSAGCLAGSVIPDLREVAGFLLTLGWTDDVGVTLEGGGKIPVQRTIGGVEIVSLNVDVTPGLLSVGIDLSFELAMVRVSAYDLAIEIDPKGPRASLGGLGVGLDTGAIRLAGMFGETSRGDYVGGAVVTLGDLFELSAIGGYTQVEKNPGDPSPEEASLFIFASLVAPLGGPPFCFVTGIAGGFGYNRGLPAQGLLAEHPFMQVMSGDLKLGGTGASDTGRLEVLSAQFPAQEGSHWIAAGVQFTSFGFIDGKLLVVVGTGHRFSLSILGLAKFAISPIASFELAFDATMDEQSLVIVAGMTPNSYIVHPDIFSLRGDFGLGVWHSGDHAGDFVLSIGGYHKYFNKPAHYPALERVTTKAVIYGFVNLSVECYFACTPQALMAGARMSLWAEFEGIGAGLEVFVDVWIKWDPFFMQASIGIVVWLQLLARIEVSAILEIHTPDFGGRAIVDYGLGSLEVDFGDPPRGDGALSLDAFLTRQLGVPAQADGANGAVVSRFSSDDRAGLMRVDVLSGRATEGRPAASGAQEGLTIATAVAVNAEFSFTVRTRLPLDGDEVPAFLPEGPFLVMGGIDLPLCETTKCASRFVVHLLVAEGTAPPAPSKPHSTTWQTDSFPVATFGGDAPHEAQADNEPARQAIATLSPQTKRVLTDQLLVDYAATTMPSDGAANVEAAVFEPSQPHEVLPLPLAQPPGTPSSARAPRPPLTIKGVKAKGSASGARRSVAGRRGSTLEHLAASTAAPLHVLSRTADLQRPVVSTRQGPLSVARPPAGTVVISPPASAARRVELAAVSLRVLPVRAPTPVTATRLGRLSRAPNARSAALTPPDGVLGPFQTTISVAQGRATRLVLDGGRRPRGLLRFSGASQVVRAIVLGAAGDPLADGYFGEDQRLALPPLARQVVLVGEGTHSPLARGAARESIGIDPGSTLLALAPRTFAGHGCVLHVRSRIALAARELDSAPGAQVLREATAMRLLFPPVPAGSSLVLRVAATAPGAGDAADEVRWATADAQLSELRAVIGPDSTALVMAVVATAAWELDLEVGAQWRIVSIAVTPREARSLAARLRSQPRWDLVDDRRQRAAATTDARVALEVA